MAGDRAMQAATTEDRTAATVVGPDASLTAYQIALNAYRLPVAAHIVANALTGLGLLLLGYPWLGAGLLVGATAFDVVQQKLLRDWLGDSRQTEEAVGLRRIAGLSLARSLIYTAPTFAMAVIGRGVPELFFFGLQLATLLAVAAGSAAFSRLIFWGFVGPLAIEVTALVGLLLAPTAALAMIPPLLVLLVVVFASSRGANNTVSAWHRAFVQSVAERAAADAAREAAAEAGRARSAFLATMSHEIRTPMNGVLGMAQLMRRDETNPLQSQRLGVLIESGEHLMAILNDVLDAARIDAGKLEIVPAPANIRALMEGLIAFWTPRAEERGLQLALRMTAQVPGRVMVDQVRLRQVLFNLVGNALKFTEAGSVDVIVHGIARPSGDVLLRVAVRDTGPGIAAQNLPTLFDRFSQAEGEDARRFGGAGLGLAIVRQLVELMDGRVWVESEVGTGSTFHIEMPLAHAAPAKEAQVDVSAPAHAAIAATRLRVLAVDDNAVNLMVVEQLLTSLDMDVTRADSGPAALEILAEAAFDLVLTDIQMPGMTGLEVLQRLRAAPGPNQAAPVIALTADVTSGGRERYLAQGFTDHSSKPIELPALLEAIDRALSAAPLELTASA
ncbi:MAG: ATP-binding protein [Pseudomonadota bacterium]